MLGTKQEKMQVAGTISACEGKKTLKGFFAEALSKYSSYTVESDLIRLPHMYHYIFNTDWMCIVDKLLTGYSEH